MYVVTNVIVKNNLSLNRDNDELKKLFSKLKNLGLVSFVLEKQNEFVGHIWKPTKKGKEIFDKDEKILELLRKGYLTEAYERIIKQL